MTVRVLNSATAALGSLNAVLVAHAANTANPHAVTKAQVGLGSADNTADTAKPVSSAQQAAFDTDRGRLTSLEAVDTRTAKLVIDARAYGVIPGSAVDNTAALQAALDAAEAFAAAADALGDPGGSALVALPLGYVKVTGVLVGDNVELDGQGDKSILQLTGGSNTNLIQSRSYGSPTAINRGIRIGMGKGLRLIGNSANQGVNTCPQGLVTTDIALSPTVPATIAICSAVGTAVTGFPATGNAWVGNAQVSYTSVTIGASTTTLDGALLLGGGAFTRQRGAWVTPAASKGHLVALQATRSHIRVYGNDAIGSGVYLQGPDTAASGGVICAENVIHAGTRLDTCTRYGLEVGVNASDGIIEGVVLGSSNLAGAMVVRSADWRATNIHLVGTYNTIGLAPQAILVAANSVRLNNTYFDTWPGTTITVDANVNGGTRITGPDIDQAEFFQCCWGVGAGGHGVLFRGRLNTTTMARSRFAGLEMWAPVAMGFTNAPWTRLVGTQNLTALPGGKLQVTSCLDFAPTSEVGGALTTSTDSLEYTGRQMYQSRLSADAAIGATSISVQSTVGADSSGTLTLLAFDGNTYTPMQITYTGKTATTFTGIPASGGGSITAAASSAGQRGGVAQHFFTGVSGGLITSRANGASVFSNSQSVTISELRESDIVYRSFQTNRHNYFATDDWQQTNGVTSGKKMRSNGTLSVAAGTLTATIAHGMAEAPTVKQLTPTADTQGRRFWATASATNITVTLDANATTNPITFDWRAEITT